MAANSKRLSEMIDSFCSERSDDLLHIPSPKKESPTREQESGFSMDRRHFSFEKPGTLHEPGPNANQFSSPNSFAERGKRESMISDYSASIHEGVPVAFIVSKSNPQDSSRQHGAPLEESSSRAAVGSSNGDENGQSDMPSRVPSTLKLAFIGDGKHKKPNSSIGSGNLASESGHSHNISSHSGASTVLSGGENARLNRSKVHNPAQQEDYGAQMLLGPAFGSADKATNHPQIIYEETASNELVITSGEENGEMQSIASSVVPPLATSVFDSSEGPRPPDRASTSDYQPSIPPRSRNRPPSHLFIKDTLDDIQTQLEQHMSLKDSVSRVSTNKSTSYYSAADQDQNDLEGDAMAQAETEDDSYLARPLPSVPDESNNVSIDRNETLLASPSIRQQQKLEQRPELPNLPLPHMANFNGEGDEPHLASNDDSRNAKKDEHLTTPARQKKGKINTTHESKPKRRPRSEMRPFDIDTISQLLNVTKGTMIGSEFANLGMRVEEKRALERLVDSLSRLTADMVLDPERFEEGLKRLEKATRALEGF
ncbi:LAMI_0H19658g1_1 [Lachancea mirantina]|uniref:LAMI_0H19658g1_1 n=1 Tax=Lachancea mirantina TaxID=1230905 RepID=A0A1G4KJW8_9SACH|nr:LAMI_0H19658g1_1 [Lachancea mirantina]